MTILLGIIAIAIPTAYAFDLPSEFDEPCPSGQSIVQQVCEVINDLHDELHIQESRIGSVNAIQISEQTEQDIIQGDIATLQTDVSVLQSNLTTLSFEIDDLQEKLFIERAIEMSPVGSVFGAINPQTKGIIFFGDTLCRIEQSGTLVIIFAANTTVVHQDITCSTENGNPINLETNSNEVFQAQDTLALQRILNEWVEVYRDQT